MSHIPRPGSTLGRFKILRSLGRGGMGIVFLARDTLLEVEVALKVLHPAYTDEKGFKRFKREALLARRVMHPGICRIYDIHVEDEVYFISMEHIEGPTLKRMLLHNAALPEATAARLGIGLAGATAAAHKHGVVHRDLKPGNIIVRETGQISVLDFGVSMAKDMARITEAGSAVGTLQYMAPEIFEGGQASALSDLYSVGVILYECVTGRNPFTSTNIVELHQAVASGEQPRPSELVPDIHPDFEAAIERAMQVDPAQRFAGVGELEHALSVIEDLDTSSQDMALAPLLAILAKMGHGNSTTQPIAVDDADVTPLEGTSEQETAAPQAATPEPSSPWQRIQEHGQPDGPTEAVPHEVVVAALRDATLAAAAAGMDIETATATQLPGRPPLFVDTATTPQRPTALWRDPPLTDQEDSGEGRTQELTVLNRARALHRRYWIVGVVMALLLAAVVLLWLQHLGSIADTAGRDRADDSVAPAIASGTLLAVASPDAAHTDALHQGMLTAVNPTSPDRVRDSRDHPGEPSQDRVMPHRTEPDRATRDAGRTLQDRQPAPDHTAAVATETRVEKAQRRQNAAEQTEVARPRREQLRAELRQLRAIRAQRGLIVGDCRPCEREERKARSLGRKRSYAEAINAAQRAQTLCQKLRIDGKFIEAKLLRFNTHFDMLKDKATKARVTELATASLQALRKGDHKRANDLLNQAFGILGRRK